MIKKLLSLISAVAILATMAVPMASAAFVSPESPITGENGIYMYASDDFEGYNEGVIASADGTAVTKYADTIMDGETDILDRWNISLSNGTASIRTGEAKITKLADEGVQVFEYSITKTGAQAGGGIAASTPTQNKINDNKKDYVVLKARMKNALNPNAVDTSSKPYQFRKLRGGFSDVNIWGWGESLKARNDYIYSVTDNSKSYNLERDWFDYMLVVSTTTDENGAYAYQVVINGEVTPVAGTVTENWSNVCRYRYIGDVGDTGGTLYLDDLTYYGVDTDENKFTYTGEWNENNLVLTFSNPVALTTDNISITDGNDATTETVSSVTYADGKFTIAFDGLETATAYTVTITGATDVFGHTAETKNFNLATAAKARYNFTADDFEKTEIGSLNKLNAENGESSNDSFTWSKVSTENNDGTLDNALKFSAQSKTEGGKTSSSNPTNNIGRLLLTESVANDAGNKYLVYKANIRFGDSDGNNPMYKAVFGGMELQSGGILTRPGVTLGNGTVYEKETLSGPYFNNGEWFEAKVAIYLDANAPATGDYYTNAHFSINGKYICDFGHNLSSGKVNKYRLSVQGVYPSAGLEESNIYIDDVEIYTLDKEIVEATALSAADKSVQFKTEHALKDLTKDKFTATVGGEAVAVSDIVVNNGIYSVIFENELPVGAEVVITPDGVTDVVGNALTGTVTATATAPAISKLSLNSSGSLRFLTLDSSYTEKPATLFIATYENDGSKLKGIKLQQTTVKPGTNYFKADVEGEESSLRAFLFNNSLAPLIAE